MYVRVCVCRCCRGVCVRRLERLGISPRCRKDPLPNVNVHTAHTRTVNQELAQQTRLPLAILCRPFGSPEEGEVSDRERERDAAYAWISVNQQLVHRHSIYTDTSRLPTNQHNPHFNSHRSPSPRRTTGSRDPHPLPIHPTPTDQSTQDHTTPKRPPPQNTTGAHPPGGLRGAGPHPLHTLQGLRQLLRPIRGQRGQVSVCIFTCVRAYV